MPSGKASQAQQEIVSWAKGLSGSRGRTRSALEPVLLGALARGHSSVRAPCGPAFANQDADTKSLPFLVRRTPSGNLPVYAHFTRKGEKFTRVRRVLGDAEHLAGEVGRPRVGRGGGPKIPPARVWSPTGSQSGHTDVSGSTVTCWGSHRLPLRLCECTARVGKGGRKAVEVMGAHDERIKEWLVNLGL